MSQRDFERELARELLRSRISIAIRAFLVLGPLVALFVYVFHFRDSQGPVHDGEALVGTIEAVRALDTEGGTRTSLVVSLPSRARAEVRSVASVPNLPGQRVRVRELLGADTQVVGYRLEGLAEPEK